MAKPQLALSLKQPWATLLCHGRKSIEVRRWPTTKRGHVLIHAARIPDPRPEAWTLVPSELLDAARQVGGIVGAGQLIDCLVYRDQETFDRDKAKHLNEPSWFQGPVMYGFVFANLKVLPFRSYPGWMRFFEVEEKIVREIHG
jgi:ASCH domain